MTGAESLSWADFAAGWDIYRDAVYTSAWAGLVLAHLSVFIVLRRMVFLSAAVTQAAGFGVALAFYLSIHAGVDASPNLVAVAAALAVAGLLVVDPARLGLSRELLLALAFLAAAGGAILLGSRIAQEAHEIDAILFGDAVLVAPEDYRQVRNLSIVILAWQLWWHRGFCFASFDRHSARVQGLPVGILDAAMMISIGAAVGVCAGALGALPVFALSTLPGAAALTLCRGRLWLGFALAALFGVASGVGGYLLAFFRGFSVGASQAVTAAAILAVALALRGAWAAAVRLRGRR